MLIDRIKHDKNIQQEQITKRYTTKVNSTLIASIVFSYSLTRCTLEIKNEVSEKSNHWRI